MKNIFKYFENPTESNQAELLMYLQALTDLENGKLGPSDIELLAPVIDIVMKHPEYAYRYATSIIKTRWHDAEEYIQKDELYWNKYCIEFNIQE